MGRDVHWIIVLSSDYVSKSAILPSKSSNYVLPGACTHQCVFQQFMVAIN